MLRDRAPRGGRGRDARPPAPRRRRGRDRERRARHLLREADRHHARGRGRHRGRGPCGGRDRQRQLHPSLVPRVRRGAPAGPVRRDRAAVADRHRDGWPAVDAVPQPHPRHRHRQLPRRFAGRLGVGRARARVRELRHRLCRRRRQRPRHRARCATTTSPTRTASAPMPPASRTRPCTEMSLHLHGSEGRVVIDMLGDPPAVGLQRGSAHQAERADHPADHATLVGRRDAGRRPRPHHRHG